MFGDDPRMCAVDGQVLLDFVHASKQLYRVLDEGPELFPADVIRRKLERWEIANATLCGNVRPT